MGNCLLCGQEIPKDKTRGDYDKSFDEIPHLECNINIIISKDHDYVEISNNRDHGVVWHGDGRPKWVADEIEKMLKDPSFFMDQLTKKIERMMDSIKYNKPIKGERIHFKERLK